MSKFKKISEYIISVLVIIIFIISALALLGAINGNKTGVNSIFGKVINTVQSDSMEDVIYAGDLIIGDVYKGQKLEKGQIITFKQKVNNTVIYNTHRIVEVQTIGVDTYVYITQGDNQLGQDPDYRRTEDIIAVYSGTRIPLVGGFIDWIKKPAGFIVCVFLPLLAVIVYEAYKIIMVILKIKEEKPATQSVDELSDEVKAEIIKQYIASQQTDAKEKKK